MGKDYEQLLALTKNNENKIITRYYAPPKEQMTSEEFFKK
jgi:hypothetical protein